MASIRKRGASWHVQVRRAGYPNVTRSFKKKSDADAWARKMESEVYRGDLPLDRRRLRLHTLADLLNRYRDTITAAKRGAVQEQYRIRQFLAHPLASVSLAKLTPAIISQYKDERLKTVQGVTVRRELALLRHVLEIARKEWDIPVAVNPVAQVSLPALPVARTRRLEIGELERLVVGCQKSRSKLLEPVILFAIETGMRRSELVNIRWSHLDASRKTLLLPTTKSGHPRIIPLTPKAVAILDGLPKGGSDKVFGLSANALRLAWERLKRRTGIENLHFHDLRHEAISRFFEKGLNVPEVALISGHRDPRMLFRYTQLRAVDLAQKLNDTCKPTSSGQR